MNSNTCLAPSTPKAIVKGSALVEFAVVVPILLIVAFGISELGRALYQHNSIGKSTDSAARYMSRAYGAVDKSNCAELSVTWNEAKGVAQNILIFGNEKGEGSPILKGMETATISVTSDARILPGETETVCVIVVASEVPFVGVFGESIVPFLDLGPITLSADREVRYIGE